MISFPRPIVCMSGCLEHDAVRYNGELVPSRIIQDLEPFVSFIQVCPETAAGLEVPREPLKVLHEEGGMRLIDPLTEEDLTSRIREFSENYLEDLGPVDGFILAGIHHVLRRHPISVYAGNGKPTTANTCSTLFAEEVYARYRGYPIEESSRLLSRKVRHYFLLRLFLFASFREHQQDHSLTDFHAANRLLIMKHDYSLFLSLDETDPDSQEYESLLKRILSHPPTPKTIQAFFKAMVPYTSHKEAFSKMIEDYAKNYVSAESCLEVLRFELIGSEYEHQTIFAPYPETLREGAEPDFTKDYWN